MTGSITLNESHLIQANGGKFTASTAVGPFNKLRANLQAFNLAGRRIGVKKINIFYSWPNITSDQSLTIDFPVGAGYSTFTWTTPALTNYKDMSTLNAALQAFCITNGLYLINNTTGDYLYYINLAANESSYKIDLLLAKVPTSLPVGYTAPVAWPGYPTTSKTMKLTIPTGSAFADIFGFLPDTYNGNTSAITYSSTYVPQFSPVSSIYCTCNLANNDLPINGSTVVTTFTARGTEYGAMIEISNNDQIDYYDVNTNSAVLEIAFFDQDWNALLVQDPRTLVQLIIA